MTLRTEKLKIINDILTSKIGKVFLMVLVRRTDLENKWDLVVSAEKIKDDNLRSDIKIVLEAIKMSSENILDDVADVLTLSKENYLFNTLLRTIEEEKVPEGFNDTLKLEGGVILKEILVVTLNLEGIQAQKKPVDTSRKGEVVFE